MYFQNRFKALIFLPVALWICGCTPFKSVEVDLFEPASFHSGSHSLSELARFPKSEEDVQVEVFCKAWVRSTGVVRNTYCLTSDDVAKPFYNSVAIAASNARAIPARQNGKSVAAYVSYIVRFERKSGIEAVSVIPNWQTYEAQLGEDYSAAQMIQTRSRIPSCISRKKATLVFHIDSQGRLLKLDYPDDDVDISCKKRLDKFYSKRRWIPAFSQGNAFQSELPQISGKR